MRTHFLFLVASLVSFAACSEGEDDRISGEGARLELACAPMGALEASHSGLCVGAEGEAAGGTGLIQASCDAALSRPVQKRNTATDSSAMPKR